MLLFLLLAHTMNKGYCVFSTIVPLCLMIILFINRIKATRFLWVFTYIVIQPYTHDMEPEINLAKYKWSHGYITCYRIINFGIYDQTIRLADEWLPLWTLRFTGDDSHDHLGYQLGGKATTKWPSIYFVWQCVHNHHYYA